MLPTTQSLTDGGYQGIQKIHANSVKPIKGSKKKPLTKQDKQHNHTVGSQRAIVEHIIREIKDLEFYITLTETGENFLNLG